VSPHHPSPPHTAPSSSSAGTTPGFYITEEMWRDHLAREQRRDDLLSTIQQQMTDNMNFMQQSQRRTDKSYDTVLQSLQVITDTQARQQQYHQRHMTLIEATQGSIIGNLREVRTTQDALQARMDQRDRRRTRSRRPPQDGEGTSGQQ